MEQQGQQWYWRCYLIWDAHSSTTKWCFAM